MNPNSDLPIVTVKLARTFSKNVLAYRKKYRSIIQDVDEFVERLKRHDLPGDRVQGTDQYTVYKARIRNSDNTKGKSGGYRVCYFVVAPEIDPLKTTIILLTIYAKADRDTIESAEITEIINDYLDNVDE